MGRKIYGKQAREITSRAGEAFEFELEGHPTAGYEWQILQGESHIEVEELEAALPDSGAPPGAPRHLVGAQTKQRFKIRATEPGDYLLVIEYGRPWEAKPEERHTIELHVVTAAGND